MNKNKKDTHILLKLIYPITYITLGSIAITAYFQKQDKNKKIIEHEYILTCSNGYMDINYFGTKEIIKSEFKEFIDYLSLDDKSLVVFVYDIDQDKALSKANFIKNHLDFDNDNNIIIKSNFLNKEIFEYIYKDLNNKTRTRK
ncbi:MAG: hypothetical protein J5634_03675 [Bacilli bacterium]|nr:hypothetical protein [Bacilli bacterium]